MPSWRLHNISGCTSYTQSMVWTPIPDSWNPCREVLAKSNTIAIQCRLVTAQHRIRLARPRSKTVCFPPICSVTVSSSSCESDKWCRAAGSQYPSSLSSTVSGSNYHLLFPLSFALHLSHFSPTGRLHLANALTLLRPTLSGRLLPTSSKLLSNLSLRECGWVLLAACVTFTSKNLIRSTWGSNHVLPPLDCIYRRSVALRSPQSSFS